MGYPGPRTLTRIYLFPYLGPYLGPYLSPYLGPYLSRPTHLDRGHSEPHGDGHLRRGHRGGGGGPVGREHPDAVAGRGAGGAVRAVGVVPVFLAQVSLGHHLWGREPVGGER